MSAATDPTVLRDDLTVCLRQSFRDQVARMAGKPFERTGVEDPDKSTAYGLYADALLAGPLATLRTDLAAREAEIAGLKQGKRFEIDGGGTWCWAVWAISETRAQLAAICSMEAEALLQVENVQHLYPDSWALHERAPVDHGFGATDLKALHWRSALSGVRRKRARAALPPGASHD